MTNSEIILWSLLFLGLIGGLLLAILGPKQPPVDPKAVEEFHTLRKVIDQWLFYSNSQNRREVLFEFYRPENRVQLQCPYLEEFEVEFRYEDTGHLLNVYYGRTYTESKVVDKEQLKGCGYFVLRFGKLKWTK
jgi:hypothetical protein